VVKIRIGKKRWNRTRREASAGTGSCSSMWELSKSRRKKSPQKMLLGLTLIEILTNNKSRKPTFLAIDVGTSVAIDATVEN